MRLFVYGSLMNHKSSDRSGIAIEKSNPAVLRGHQRKISVAIKGYLYLNLIRNQTMNVDGRLLTVPDEQLEKVQKRESGYELVDVSRDIEPESGDRVFAFIAQDREYPTLKIPRSYLRTCMAAVPADKRDQWLRDTIIKNEVEEDLMNPVYENAVGD